MLGMAYSHAGLGIASREACRSLSGSLGTIPNDDERARDLCYTPVSSAWVFGNRITGQRYYEDGFYGARPELLSDDASLTEIMKLQKRQTLYQGITTVAIVAMATAAVATAVGASRKRKRG